MSDGRLPSIIIAGFQKCGTSALHQILLQHPDVAEAKRWDETMPGSPPKELHFFNEEVNFRKGAAWYSSCFPDTDAQCLDSTPEYIRSKVFVQRMAKMIPDARIILLMRDPLSRAFSAWNHWTQDKSWPVWEPSGDFGSNVRAEVRSLQRNMNYKGPVSRGFYIDQITWVDHYFPKDQVYLGFMEDLRNRPSEEIAKIQSFLGLRKKSLEIWDIHSRRYEGPPPTSDVIERLRIIYEPYDEKLAERVGRELPWKC